MANDDPPRAPGMTDLLRALAQVGRIAEAMLAQQEEATAEPVAAEPEADSLPAAPVTSTEQEEVPQASRPGAWRDSVPAAPRQFFTKHAAERLHERYGVSHASMVPTMASLAHQIHGTHLAGIEAVNLGQRPPSEGVSGTIWAVEIFRQVGFVVTDDDGLIVTVLPRDTKQVQGLNGPQRAALEAFKTELHLRHSGPVHLAKYHGRG